MIKLMLIFFTAGVGVFLLTFKLSLKVRLISALLSFLVPSILFYVLLYNTKDSATPGSTIITEEMLDNNDKKDEIPPHNK